MSLIFTGAQYLSLASQVAKAFPFTFACWYKPATVAGSTPYCLITQGHTTTTVHYNTIQIANAKASISIPGASASSVASLTAGIWYHVVGVFSNANSKTVYLNGIGASTTVPSSLPTENITAIGAIFYGSSTTPIDFANGSIAYPSIWNLSLTQADVAALYNSGSGSDPRTVEPSNWLSFLTLTVGPPFVDQVSGSTWTSSGAPAVDTDPFSIPPVASPIMTVVGATNVQATMATLTGKLVFTRGGLPTVEGFHYGTTTGYGSTVQTTNAGGYAAGSFSLNVTGLAPATLYHFQSFSTNSGGTGVSADVFFTTATSWPPPGTPTLFNDRMGFACNFDLQGVEGNWVPATVIPLIANSGVGWVRDTINWSQFEPTAGNYVAYAPKVAWMTQFHTAGLKFCGLIQYPPLFYGNTSISPNEHWPLQETANFCAWLATTGIVDAIEVINEANNMTQFGGPANGGTLENLQALVALTNAVTASVHAVAPNMPVIGLNEQGSEVLYMLGQNPQLDGLVYHAYDLNDNIPENAYEPPYLNYSNWVKVVQGTTTLPIWETEGNTDPNRTGTPWGEYTGAVWLARRLLLSWWFDIAHFFIYTFTAGDLESSLDYFLGFRQQYWVLQRMLVALQGVSTTGGTVALSNLSDGLDASGVYSTVFCSRTSTLVSVWLGNNSASNPPVYGTADLSFTLLNTHVTDTIVDSVSGDVSDLSQYTTSSSGHTFTIHGFPVTDTPQLITISGATINAVPLVIAQMAVNPGVNSAVLIGSATYDGGSNITLTGFNVGLTTAYELIAFSIVQRGIGSFTSTVTGLQSGTTYHYRGFANNSTGTGVSSDQTFTTITLVSVPVMAVTPATLITANSVTLNGSIVADGESSSTMTGFVYGLTASYTNTVSTSQTLDTGPFSNNVPGLLNGTTYHFASFATNATGTGFSSDLTFTTAASSPGSTGGGGTVSTSFPPGVFPIEASNIGTSLTLYNASLLDYCNPAVKQDQAFVAICKALDPQLKAFLGTITNCIILSNISNQSAEVLDFLALYHFNVDYYDTTLPIATKLLLIQNVIQDKISKGTPSRVINLINQVFAFGELIEWFNDSPPAEANTFRIQIADPLTDPTTVANLFRAILSAKNVRSYFGGISSFQSASFQNWLTVGAAQYDYQVLTWPRN